MTSTNTSEKGLESIVVASLVEEAGYIQEGIPQDYEPGTSG
jgi:type I restriction enzyme R subunit